MKCTYRAAELLKKNQKLKVHSVYRHTINIVVKDRILAFHRNIIPLTPLSLALPFSEKEFDCFEMEAQRTGVVNLYVQHMAEPLHSISETQRIKVTNFNETEIFSPESLKSSEFSDRCCWIQTGNFEKNAGKIILWEDRLDRRNKSDVFKPDWDKQNIADSILPALLPILTQNYQLGGFSDCAVTSQKRKDDSFITQILRNKTAAILSENMSKDISEHVTENLSKETGFEKLIGSLIGLGPGLTPSGDDFLTGMLFAFVLQETIGAGSKTDMGKIEEKKKQVCKVISENLKRTNDISKEYLFCAMENRFGELYHMLQEQFFYGSVKKDLFCRIIHTGHSSGLDTLNGLAVGLKITEQEQ